MISRFCVTISFLLLSFAAEAFEAGKIYSGTQLAEITLDQLLDSVEPGQIVMVSEFHGVAITHELQKSVIQGLTDRGHKVNMGIEHFSHLEQVAIDAYLKNELSEDALVRTVRLSDFANWKDQMWLPLQSGGWSYGINAPRWLTSKIGAVGYKNLSVLEKQILPSDFTIGTAEYFERFLAAMGATHAVPGFEKIFEAQSAWDDTSALILKALIQNDPKSIFVVLFGDFHISYGGGLPDRLQKRGFTKTLTISQFCVDGLSPQQVSSLTMPHPTYGPRADYVRPVKCQN